MVRDLTVEGTLTPGGSKSGLGLIAGENSGTISGCTVSGTVTGDEDVGGIARPQHGHRPDLRLRQPGGGDR